MTKNSVTNAKSVACLL